MYCDEDLLLDLRLNFLNKYVKKFVITEATYTHNGSKKKLRFDINKFSKFKDKISYIILSKIEISSRAKRNIPIPILVRYTIRTRPQTVNARAG